MTVGEIRQPFLADWQRRECRRRRWVRVLEVAGNVLALAALAGGLAACLWLALRVV